MERISYQERDPDLFAPLGADQVWAVEQALANGRLEGWQPTREEIADLIAGGLGRLSFEDYLARARNRAAASRQASASA